MTHTVYTTKKYLVEIEDVKTLGNMGTSTYVWQWEITLAENGKIVKGKAECQNKKFNLSWMELQTADPLTEMIEACKRFMDNH